MLEEFEEFSLAFVDGGADPRRRRDNGSHISVMQSGALISSPNHGFDWGSLNCSDYLALFGSVARLGRCPRKHEGLLLVLSIQTLYALADSLVGKYIVWQDVLHKR